MLEAVVDTNVLISGLLKGRTTRPIINAILNNELLLVTSIDILDELMFTLRKPRINSLIPESDIVNLFNLIKKRARFVIPKIKLSVCRDSKDNKFLECAVEAEIKLIISGDNDLLCLSPFKEIEISRPQDFLKRLNK